MHVSVCPRRSTCEILLAFLVQLHVAAHKTSGDGGTRANALSSAGCGLLWPATALRRSTDQACFMGAAAPCGAAGEWDQQGGRFGGGLRCELCTAGRAKLREPPHNNGRRRWGSAPLLYTWISAELQPIRMSNGGTGIVLPRGSGDDIMTQRRG